MSLPRRVVAESIGTCLLLATVVGSGIMGVALSGGNDALALLANAAVTAGILYVSIAVLGPISGAHFNPAVTLAARLRGELPSRDAAAYVAVQFVAAIAGVVLAHAMFDQPLLQPGDRVRTGAAQWLSEGVATAGLLLTIRIGARVRPAALPSLVAAYVFAAYWFTASTSFANPAVTLARALTATFSGIRPTDVCGFVASQLAGVAVALVVESVLFDTNRRERATSARVGSDNG